MQYAKRYQQARRVTFIGIIINLLLSIIKILFGIFGYSQALIVDGIHSLSDLLTDILVLLAAKASNQQPDIKHPYGHGRIETFFTIILACFLIVVGLGIAYDVIYHLLIHARILHPSIATLFVAIISILANEWLFRVTLKIGQTINSNMLIANAWHHRSDALSSLIVLVGIAGAIMGLHYLDAVAAIVVALLIGKMGIKMIWSSVRELIDTAVEENFLKEITAEIAKIPGIESVHQLRTRSLGGFIFVDVHVLVDPMISVSEGHFIGEQVPKRLREKFSKIFDVTVHVDIAEDENFIFNLNLPDRAQMQTELNSCWHNLPGFARIQKIILHYIDDKIAVDLYLPLDICKSVAAAKDIVLQYQKTAQTIQDIGKVTVYFTEES